MYTYKENLALNNLQELICHKIQPTNPKLYFVYGGFTTELFILSL